MTIWKTHLVILLFKCNLKRVQQGSSPHPLTSAAFTLSFIRCGRAKVSSRKNKWWISEAHRDVSEASLHLQAIHQICAANSLSRSVPSSDWLPWCQCAHLFLQPEPRFGSHQPLSLPPLSQWDKGPTNQSCHRPTNRPPTLSAARRKTQLFIHLFPPSLFCSLFILVNITSPVGTLRGS